MSIKRKLRAERDEARHERDEAWIWLDDAIAWVEDTVADYPRFAEARKVRDRLAVKCAYSIEQGIVVYDEPVTAMAQLDARIAAAAKGLSP